jgi:sulfoxide reductase heme-binding subunit YedZ
MASAGSPRATARPGHGRWALTRAAVVASCLAPMAWIGWSLARGGLVDPVAVTLNRLGFWTLTLLLVTLSATPARIVFGLVWPSKVRRLLGLFTFAYATVHALVYLVVDQGLDVHDIIRDVAKHRFVTAGAFAFLVLVPLAATSSQAAVRRLGGRRWRRLHRLVYLAAVAGVVHFFWRVKADQLTPFVFAAVLALLLAVRLVNAARRRRARAPQAPA